MLNWKNPVILEVSDFSTGEIVAYGVFNSESRLVLKLQEYKVTRNKIHKILTNMYFECKDTNMTYNLSQRMNIMIQTDYIKENPIAGL